MIGWYVHHHGLGHANRFASVARHLGTPVTGLSSLAVQSGLTVPWLQLARDDGQPEGAQSSDPTAYGVLHWVPRHHSGLARRTAQIATWIDSTRPAVMVVDVSVEVTLLARLAGVPVVVVAMPGGRGDRAHRSAYDVADALLAPWPGEAHTAGWPTSWRDKLVAVGGISRFDDRPAPAGPENTEDRPRRVLVLWGAGGRGTGDEQVRAARGATPEWQWLERGPGSPSPDLWRDLMDADVVVTHAGQNAVAEVAAARRPAVVVAQPRPFDEQHATAAAVKRLGAAVGLARWPSDARAWPDLLERAARLGGGGWSRWSTGHGGRDAAKLLDALAGSRPGVAPRRAS